jgi:hypothetical protein
MRLGRSLIIAGGVVLLVAGLLHAYAYRFVVPKFASALASQLELPGVFKSLWLSFSAQWVLIGLLVLWMTRLSVARSVFLLCGLIPAVASLLMLHYIGIFIGSVILAVAASLIIVGSLLTPRAQESHPASRMW